ncbi:hypothetical protein [Anaplasma platys]|uniref:hypothetical protein n=1 Tax=Anaplasma platys TaxID=949 RepID=UPI00145CF10B|nr:hypothetical protein [Anaplasma platys]
MCGILDVMSRCCWFAEVLICFNVISKALPGGAARYGHTTSLTRKEKPLAPWKIAENNVILVSSCY